MLPLEDLLRATKEVLDRSMRTGTYSFGFLVDIAMITALRRGNAWQVIGEVAAMEGIASRPSSTKPEKPLTSDLLRGYWHKHFTDDSYLPHNVCNEMRRDNTICKVLKPYIGQDFTAEILGELTHALVLENYHRRRQEGRLTGEWIVFSKTGTGNHYMTLAQHTDGNEAIAERIQRYAEIDTNIKGGVPSGTIEINIQVSPETVVLSPGRPSTNCSPGPNACNIAAESE